LDYKQLLLFMLYKIIMKGGKRKDPQKHDQELHEATHGQFGEEPRPEPMPLPLSEE
jgi:hypothetical protein